MLETMARQQKYHGRDKKMHRNHYYKSNKDRLQKMVHNRYRGLSEEEKQENR